MSAVADPLPSRSGWDLWEPLFRLAVILAGAALLAWSLATGRLLPGLGGSLAVVPAARGLRLLLAATTAIFLGALLWRTGFWFRYRPHDSQRVDAWPEVTVVLPAYNEGQAVLATIDAIMASDYPAGPPRLIAVDDGSRDDTLRHLQDARRRYPGRVEVIGFPENRGKRQALYEAFRRVATPVVVTVDSDTQVAPDAIRELVAPLLLAPRLAAVTGRIRILNRRANLFTRMLDVNFAMAFDFTRAVESTFSSVFCTSGAFSAYRCEALRGVLDDWRGQRFLGRTCTYGEDRSLANCLLRRGLGTAFQRTADARTRVPESAGGILRMLTRWARSNIRESIVFAGLMFGRSRRGNRVWPFLEFLGTSVLVLLHLVWFYALLASGLADGEFLLRALASTVLFGFLYMLYFIRIDGGREFPYALAFALFCAPLMVGIFTVAGFTLTTRSWSTR
jgi:hyaluronan synthase